MILSRRALVSEESLLEHVSNLRPDWFSKSKKCRIFKSPAHAMSEVVKGLISLFPQKKTVAILKGSSPIFKELRPLFAKEGMKIKELTIAELEQPKLFIEGIAKDLLMILLAEDEPFTGQIFNIKATIDEAQVNKIYAITVSHSLFWYEKEIKEVPPFSARIFDLGLPLSLGLFGSRTKPDTLIFGDMNWSAREVDFLSGLNLFTSSKTVSTLDSVEMDEAAVAVDTRKLVLDFENKKVAGAESYFRAFFSQATAQENSHSPVLHQSHLAPQAIEKPQPLVLPQAQPTSQAQAQPQPFAGGRIFDRACVYWEDLNSQAVAHVFNKKMNLSGMSNMAISGTECFWGVWGINTNLIELGISENVLRGLLILPAEVLSTEAEVALGEAVRQVRELQV